MAKKKISGLPAGSALNGTELVPIVQTGTTKRITTQDIANLGNASGVEGSGTINNLAKFTASSTIGNSAFFDDGTNQGTETTTAVNRFIMSANASIAKIFSFRSANLPRWAFRVDGTESGANAGADLAIRRYNDAGTFIDSSLFIKRSTGNVGIGNTAPNAKLEITSTALGSEGLRVDGNGAGFAFVVKGGNDYTSHIRAGATIGVNYFTTPPSNGLIVEGNVGIGTTSTSTKLTIKQSSDNVLGGIRIQKSDNDTSLFLFNNGSVNMISSSYGSTGAYVPLYFQTSDLNRLVIDTDGSVLIGTTTNSGYKLDVNGTANFSGAVSIGNSVASGIAVASTHKVTIVIGGVTYYLLASNV